jgi:hypothetical protein
MKTVIEIAFETGFDADDETTLSSLERFTALIRADEQKKWEEQTVVEIHEAVLEEREACEKVCELVAREIDDTNGTASYIAAAMRARGIK